jgi:hypothetical protein
MFMKKTFSRKSVYFKRTFKLDIFQTAKVNKVF